MKLLAIIITILILPVGIAYLFPQITFRAIPNGLIEGYLPENKPNWVSSKVSPNNAHYIAPLQFKSLSELSACIASKLPFVSIQSIDESKLIGYRQSKIFHFVDWFCINADGTVSSSATIGHSDFGKNRELVEQIRMLCS